MSTPCTTCGRPLHAGDARCPACDALASPTVDETTSQDAAPTTAAGAPPWSIPIREPRPSTAPAAGGDGRRPLALAALGVVALLVVVLLGSRFVGGDDGDTDAASGGTATTTSATPDETGGMDADVVGSDSTTSTTEAPSTTTTTTAAPATTSTTSAAPRTTAAPAPTTTAFSARTDPNGTGSVPALSTRFRGWLAQLTSVPYDAGTDGLADEWRRTRGSVPGVVAARSNDWSAFQDGFWVLVDPGPFGSPAEVRAFCASVGLDGDRCLARELRG